MRFMLYEFLKDNYKEAEPIFFSDIVIKGITKSAVNQQLKKLCDEGKLQKYENGIYYLLCMCTPLYNETLRGCFTVGEKKKYQKKMMINGELVIE